MKKILLWLCFVALPTAYSQSFPLEKVLAEESVIFVTFLDFETAKTRWSQNKSGQILKDEEVQRFLEHHCQDVEKEVKSFLEDVHYEMKPLGIVVPLDLLWNIPAGKATYALVELKGELANEHSLFGVEVKGEREKLVEFFEQWLKVEYEKKISSCQSDLEHLQESIRRSQERLKKPPQPPRKAGKDYKPLSPEEIEKQKEKIAEQIAKYAANIEKKTEEIKSLQAKEWHLVLTSFNGHEIFESPIDLMPSMGYFSFVGGVFLHSSSKALLQDILSHKDGGREKSLVSNRAYLAVKHKLGADKAVLFSYLNTSAIFQRSVGEEHVAEILDKAGLRDIEGVGCAIHIADDRIHIPFYLYAPGARRGILKILAGKPIDKNFIDKIPGSSVGFCAAHFDWRGKKEEFEKCLTYFDHLGKFSVNYQKLLAMLEAKMGLPLTNETLSSLEEYHSFAFFPPKGGLLPYIIHFYESHPEKVLDFIRGKARLLDLEIQELQYQGKQIGYYRSPLSENISLRFYKSIEDYFERFDNSMEQLWEYLEQREEKPASIEEVFGHLKPFFAVANTGNAFFQEGNRIYLTSSCQVMEEFLTSRNSKEWQKNFSQHAEWQRLSLLIPDGVSFLMYCDVRRSSSFFWDSLLSLSDFWESSNMHIEYFPRGQTLAKYLPSLLVMGFSDAQGIGMGIYLLSNEKEQ